MSEYILTLSQLGDTVCFFKSHTYQYNKKILLKNMSSCKCKFCSYVNKMISLRRSMEDEY